MTAAEEPPSAQQHPQAAEPPAPAKVSRPHRNDRGPDILPSMEYFVALTRKCGHPALVLALVERSGACTLPALAPLAAAKGTLDLDARQSLFQTVATLRAKHRQRIELAAERIALLNDHYGALAVQSLLDEHEAGDAAVLAPPTDRFARALHLFLCQELPEPGVPPQQRFDRAERLHVLNRQWRVQAYASHFKGPKGELPKPLAEVEEALRERMGALFPKVHAEQILFDQFTRGDLGHAHREHPDHGDALALLYTLTATFNGTTVQYPQVANGEVIEREEPAALSVCFSWDPHAGALAVFCEDPEARRPLAMAFRDVVLGCAGDIHTMPLHEYDLSGFGSPAMLTRLERDLVPGVEKVSILQVTAMERVEQRASLEAEDRTVIQALDGFALIGRDRRDPRDIYQFARDVYHLGDLTGYFIAKVKLVFRMARQPHRRTHNVSFQITMPDGLTDSRITDIDRRLIIAQLVRLSVVSEF